MKTLIKNVKFNNEITNILIEDGKISKITTKNEQADEVIDCVGSYAYSGNCNGYFDGVAEDAENLVCQGYTTVFDFSNDISVTKKLVENGLKVYTAVGDFNGTEIINKAYLDERINTVKTLGVVKPILFISDINLEDENQYAELIKYAKENGLIISTNVSETLERVGEIDNKYGLSPILLLESYGFLDYKNLLIGAVYADKEDVEVLKNYESTVCVRPSMDLKNGNGIAPTYSFVKSGVNVVIGGVTNSVFQEVELAKNLQSGILNEEEILSHSDVLKFANENFKNVFSEIGGIKVGEMADLIITNRPYEKSTPLNVEKVFVNGKLIYSK